jgi:hypothetical protein
MVFEHVSMQTGIPLPLLLFLCVFLIGVVRTCRSKGRFAALLNITGVTHAACWVCRLVISVFDVGFLRAEPQSSVCHFCRVNKAYNLAMLKMLT